MATMPRRLIGACALALALGACGARATLRDLTASPRQPPPITGIITEVRTVRSGGLLMRVEGGPDQPGGAIVIVSVTARTTIYRAVGETLEPASPDRLVLRARVLVMSHGGVRPTVPAQADAKEVLILP